MKELSYRKMVIEKALCTKYVNSGIQLDHKQNNEKL